MACLGRTKPLSVCIARCVELIQDLTGIHQFWDLQQQVKALLSSLLSMMRAVRPYEFDDSQSDPTYSPGLSLLAAYLHELKKTCGYYGTDAETEWKLSDEDRAFVLCEISNPFNRIAETLLRLARVLQAVIEDGKTDHHTRVQKLCEWAEYMFEGWKFFQGEFEAARTLAAAISAGNEGQSSTETFVTADESGSICSNKDLQNPEPQKAKPQKAEPQKATAWNQIGKQLAEEGIEDDAIEKVANDLKACVRSLIRGESPKVGRDKAPASDKVKTPSVSTRSSAKKTATSAISNAKATSAIADDWFNREFVSSKVTAALDKIKGNFDVYLPELLVVAFKQETEKDSRNYCQALDLIYTMGRDDVSRSRLHARLAKEIQARTPDKIRRIMVSKGGGTVPRREEPVTIYLLNKCSVDWEHGKHGRNKVSVENFALGLSRFIGELAKFGVFNADHVHSFIRAQWGPTLNRNQFMALYKLLRTTGPMLDSMIDTSDMDDHFKRISGLANKKKTPEPVKALGQELLSLRSSGWKSKQTKEMDKVEDAIRKKT